MPSGSGSVRWLLDARALALSRVWRNAGRVVVVVSGQVFSDPLQREKKGPRGVAVIGVDVCELCLKRVL